MQESKEKVQQVCRKFHKEIHEICQQIHNKLQGRFKIFSESLFKYNDKSIVIDANNISTTKPIEVDTISTKIVKDLHTIANFRYKTN